MAGPESRVQGEASIVCDAAMQPVGLLYADVHRTQWKIAAAMRRSGRGSRGNPPDGIADIVGYQQGPVPIHGNTNRPAECLAVPAQESGQHVDWNARRAAGYEWYEDDLIAAERSTIP